MLKLEDDITTDLSTLQSHLDGMLDRVQQNGLTLKRFQEFEMRLLNLNSLAEMVDQLLEDAKSFFNLDVISFCLIDEDGEIKTFLNEDGYETEKIQGLIFLQDKALLKSTFGFSTQPFLGTYRHSNCAAFFPNMERRPSSVAVIPLSRRGKYLGSLNLGSYTPNRFINDMATDFIEHMVSVVSICLENNLNFELMRRSSLMDTLTGVNNRRFLEQRIVEEVNRSHRYQEPLSCLFLDIDYFKKVNDTYGHQAGDYVLTLIAGVIKKQLRNNDVLARYGGEEFVALLSNSHETMAYDIAERIRTRIRDLALNFNEHDFNVTISIGLSTYQPNELNSITASQVSEKLIHSADTALYFAKHHGRNKVAKGEFILDADLGSRKVS